MSIKILNLVSVAFFRPLSVFVKLSMRIVNQVFNYNKNNRDTLKVTSFVPERKSKIEIEYFQHTLKVFAIYLC